jgi:hypothetical protein
MSSQFNDKHLLWWVLKAVNACRAAGTRPDTLLSETMWKNIGAPEWVLPAMREKYEELNNS